MRPVSRTWIGCLAIVVSACSAVVDFPNKVPVPDVEDGGMDSGRDAKVPDGSDRDAVADGRADTGPVPGCTQNSECANNELCCPGTGGSMSCETADVSHCTSCMEGCRDPSAPNCGARVCECVAGSGKGCATGEICMGAGNDAKCVQCATDADCGQMTGRNQCVNNQCVQCDRGAMADSAADDEGCSGVTPVCGPSNVCIGCNDSAPATQCPNGLTCNPGQGCFGCMIGVPIGMASNRCPDTTPVCKNVGGNLQCVGCTTNQDCAFPEGQGYCAQQTGLCSNKCDPDIPAGGTNGCAAGTPLCKAAAVPGGVDCMACTPADCTGNTPHCAMAGNKSGSCVQCTLDAHCVNPLAPVCDPTSNTCRARTATDCAAPTPYLDTTGACVACTMDTHCTSGHCSLTTKTCVECTNHSQCPNTKPSCNATTNVCEVGCSAEVCAAHTPPLASPLQCTGAGTCAECAAHTNCNQDPAKPLCDVASGTCVPCTTMPISVTDAGVVDTCATKTVGKTCRPSGPHEGKCCTNPLVGPCD